MKKNFKNILIININIKYIFINLKLILLFKYVCR